MDARLRRDRVVPDVRALLGLRHGSEHRFLALGFETRRAEPEGAPTYAAMRKGDNELMLSKMGAFSAEWPLERMAGARMRAGGGAATMYIESEDIEGDCKRARGAGASVLEGVVDRPWGQKEFVVEDPDGNWWTFWQVVEKK
jgi:uncharacterized glyoxalase superfamily protein PhnB